MEEQGGRSDLHIFVNTHSSLRGFLQYLRSYARSDACYCHELHFHCPGPYSTHYDLAVWARISQLIALVSCNSYIEQCPEVMSYRSIFSSLFCKD